MSTCSPSCNKTRFPVLNDAISVTTWAEFAGKSANRHTSSTFEYGSSRPRVLQWSVIFPSLMGSCVGNSPSRATTMVPRALDFRRERGGTSGMGLSCWSSTRQPC